MKFTILEENNPAAAEFLKLWQSKYQENFDLSKIEDQANFYEAVLEMARFMAKNSSTASIECSPTSVGVGCFSISTTPKF